MLLIGMASAGVLRGLEACGLLCVCVYLPNTQWRAVFSYIYLPIFFPLRNGAALQVDF